MKNQYFGDVNDFRKYGLLRAIAGISGLSIGIAWMLSENDEKTDGERRAYLDQVERFRYRDPDLFDRLCTIRDPGVSRTVRHATDWSLIPRATYFDELLHDDTDRGSYFSQALKALGGSDLVFFDPDNGLDVKSVGKGHKNSHRYLFLDELGATYCAGHSVLVYQHFPRIERSTFVAQTADRIRRQTGCAHVRAYETAHVVFLLAPQPRHEIKLSQVDDLINARWQGQISARIVS